MKKTKKNKNSLLKKTNVRSKTKWPALKPHLNLKTRYDEIKDILSYVDQLNDKEKDWLSGFVSEYVNADFKHGGKILHKGKKNRKICTDKNNARWRCQYTKAKSTGNAVSLTDLEDKDLSVDKTDKLIDIVDLKNNLTSWDIKKKN